ncbi:MAG TPA: DUF3488 and transglutaminase-like domain-containing protein [Gammaproteobacteria bacterium]|nr:DUF3488 and transglutaminase-like domain-containing protein [Gammaproteobacteria bacterium]
MTAGTISLYHYSWLVTGVAMAVLPHITHMPLWIVLLSLGMMAYRLVHESGRLHLAGFNPMQSRLFRLMLIALAFTGIWLQFGTLIGRDAGSALLVLLTGLKILEADEERDFYIASFLGFFVIITGFFYMQSILSAVYMTLTLLVMINALLEFNDPDRIIPLTRKLGSASLLFFQALPLAIVLFLLFPRINGPLWGLPEDAFAGLTGIDDVMEPGSISRLIHSDEVAFRARFEDTRPERSDLYWRGPVLWYTNGTRWTRDDSSDRPVGRVTATGETLRYTITQEPTNKHWLFALEMPLAAHPPGELKSEYQLYSREPIRQRLRYELESSLEYRLMPGNTQELQRALQLPEGYHPRARELAFKWLRGAENKEDVIARTLKWFNEEEFYYTLTPPLLENDRVDEFLFQTRQGFCEHYASAFVVLMRAASIPARVVTGYQGGEYNPIGDYFIVHQRDAHAWAEVWIDNRGWIRVDPTAAVAPERVEQGIQQALPESVIDIPLAFGQNRLSRDLWERFSNTWDAINNQWNQWVISYGPRRQAQFLKQIGLPDISMQELALLMAACVIVLFIAGTALLLRRRLSPVDPARKYYDQFCRKMANAGIARYASEGPLDFARRANRKRKDLASTVNGITDAYIATRYASDTSQLSDLAKRVRRFSPRNG